MLDIREAALVEHGLDHLAFHTSAAVKSMNHGHRDLAFSQVARHRLSQNFLRSGQIQYVIHDLERQSKVAPILTKAILVARAGTTQYRAEFHRHREQTSRLSIDQVEMF